MTAYFYNLHRRHLVILWQPRSSTAVGRLIVCCLTDQPTLDQPTTILQYTTPTYQVYRYTAAPC